ncbi:hypothetical protein GKO32_11280 [Amycolatopsis sp. RM579]|uniref:Uncharacterized protein n=1 Tax=Amycolatopsis pithecellobii TaxID=664692 RepID=A0A6N7YNJ6_9PSEU|nr:hypothetical protein [Amycolatopsis pithecellobii]
MRITHYGHACVLVETAAGSRVLIDPGTDSPGTTSIRTGCGSCWSTVRTRRSCRAPVPHRP